MDWLKELSSLGPALGSVVVMGLLCERLLNLFSKFNDSFAANQQTMQKLSSSVEDLSKNVKENTEVTERMSSIIDQQYTYVPRQSPAHKLAR